jgi:thiosulfate dehydrogenase
LLMKKGMVGLSVGFVVGIILIPLIAFVCIRLGYAPVATASPPLPLEKWLAHTALKATVAREAPSQCPIQASETNLLAGAKIYREDCAMCHGTVGQGKTPFAKGMYPPPPQLFVGTGVTDDPVGHTYWKAANGIRLTGMPAFGPSLSQTQLWQVSQLLANTHHLSAAVTNVLTSAVTAR